MKPAAAPRDGGQRVASRSPETWAMLREDRALKRSKAAARQPRVTTAR